MLRPLILCLGLAIAVPALAQTPPPVVGGDADAHGCRPSAGYSYSVVRQGCIRPWEAGIKLMPLTPQGSATYAAYVVFASGRDGRRAELFLYNHKGALVLKKTRRGKDAQWRGGGFALIRHKGVLSLKGPGGRELYRESHN